MEQSVSLEREFLARVFYRRGRKNIVESYVDAKSLGACVDWFDDPSSRIVWQAAEELFTSKEAETYNLYALNKRATAIASKSKDKDIRCLVFTMEFFNEAEKGVSGADDLGGFCTLLRNAAVARKCLEAFQQANDAFRNENDSVGAAAKLINQVQSIINGEQRKGRESASDLSDEVLEQYDNAHHHVQELGESDWTPGLPLPWKKLAFAMNGFPSVLTVVAARPGVGKTSFAVEMMRYWMDHGIKVVFDSLDMAGVEFIKRQISEISQISSRKLQFGKSDADSWEKYDRPGVLAAIDKIKTWERDGIFTLYTEPDIDILKANVKILRDQGKIDVLVIDYIQLMGYRGSDKYSRQQVVTRVSNMLHSITTELGVPVLALSQINRDSSKEGVEPQLHDIKDSGAIEQDASNVIILHPDKKVRKAWDERPPEAYSDVSKGQTSLKALMPMWVILAKSRDGDAGTQIPFVVVQNKYSWYQADYKADTVDMFNRVWSSWKHDPIEKLWRRTGALIDSDEMANIDRINAASEARLESATQNAEEDRPYENVGFEGGEF